ncbi:hypothetical protein [Streptomyces griseocarneus]|uniref:hypothetical protein n=1 Tax=Streptomyces griseocarneus TaxID=51201 RepID=UPI00167D4C51|nr:hypothetical protein [Streptomyces griseocarneus]MBZ6472555.1 hypothetical protein [Streptomyces griseocarneus]GHG45901.1 hypothetical protein GCM10018779_02120 [Streptomyces griseocarneus]
MENAISFEELDNIAGEVLPERTVMGIIATPLAFADPGPNGSGAGAGASSSSAASGGGVGGVFAPPADHHGTTMLAACQAVDRQGTPGLLGSLGLPSTNPTTSMTCMPTAISTH